VLYTAEDGRNYRPKYAELIEAINGIITVASSWLFILLHVTILQQHIQVTCVTITMVTVVTET